MSNELIKVPALPDVVEVTFIGQQVAQQILDECGFVESVNTPAEAQSAGETLVHIATYKRSIENARESLKRPFLETGRKIDSIAKNAVEKVEVENERIKRLIGDYNRREQERLEAERKEAERKAQEEAREIARLTREAEEARQRAAAEQDAAKRALAEAEAASKEQAAAAAEWDAGERQANAGAIVTAPPKVEGVSVRTVNDFEVLDIHALYASNRNVVKLEPDRAVIKAMINTPGFNPALLKGIRIFPSTQTSVRAKK